MYHNESQSLLNKSNQQQPIIQNQKYNNLKPPPPHLQTLIHTEFLQDKMYTACYPFASKLY